MAFSIMVRLSTLYLAFTIALVSVPEARSQTTVPIPPCIQTCIQVAAGASGCSPTDPNCACFSDTFINTVADCVVAQCTGAEVQAAQQIFRQFCSGATTSVAPSDTSSITGTPTGTELSTTGNTTGPTSTDASTSTPANPAEQSTLASITSGSSHTSTSSTASPTTANHAAHGLTAGWGTGAAFAAFALALAPFAW